MADIHAIIETMEHRFMRAWIGRDVRELKALTSRNFRMVIGSKPATLLDYKSWIEAASKRYRCKGYRFGDIYAREIGRVAVFATHLELESTLDGEDWSGAMWVTDIWRKSRVRRKWRLVERVLSKPDQRDEVAAGIRSLQLWRQRGRASQ